MCTRYVGFALLVWFPGVLCAQSAAQPCRTPRLKGGFFVPEQEAYSHETELTYACDDGLKPVVEGWWATSTCQNGTWSHEPQCIDENACLPPTIPNAKYTVNRNGWYENRETIRITCEKGYDYKNRDATAECINGTWSSVPVCERSINACGEPPKFPHAVIIHQGYQDLFPVDSEVQYECEDEYTLDGTETKKSTYCISGNWTTGPTCSRETRPGTGHGGSAVGGSGSRPDSGQGGSAGGGHTTSGSGTKPTGGGSSSSSGEDGKETQVQITTITNCGKHPVVPNGDVVRKSPMFLRYQCASFYKRVGPDTVMCYSTGMWSDIPTCKAAFCSVNTDEYPALIPAGIKFLRDGERATLECVKLDHWWTDHYSVARCINGKTILSRCCGWFDLRRGVC
ncbi:complement factor H-like [Plectropomus leopardus]|uniref:complement factor H-like n=1 Tax=Plectropomus leopardus TaxID=160734 RepID=UPI001C4B49DE|nr:complement factor H-like [Plectropomus leopardus]